MKSNKIFFDTYASKNRDNKEQVTIVLVDAKIYTIVTRKELFGNGMFHGCFLETKCYESEQEAKANAMRLTHAIGARRVSREEFDAIERQNEQERVSRAFAMAEAMIAQG